MPPSVALEVVELLLAYWQGLVGDGSGTVESVDELVAALQREEARFHIRELQEMKAELERNPFAGLG